MNIKKKVIIGLFIIFAGVIGGFGVYGLCTFNRNSPSIKVPEKRVEKKNSNDFVYSFLHEIDYDNKNFLVSPLSVGSALFMVKDGASGNTKKQIEDVLNNYTFSPVANLENIIGNANSIFIRNDFSSSVKQEFIKELSSNYNAEVVYDLFENPDNVNKWVSDKTFGMIPTLVDDLGDTVMILMNALAIDVDWKQEFKCDRTSKEEFTLTDTTKKEVSMMHSDDNSISYIENDNAKGIIKPYALYDVKTSKRVFERTDDTLELEYVAIMPNENIENYIEKFDEKELSTLLDSEKKSSYDLSIILGLPKYTYDFTLNDFKDILVDLGMTDAFNPNLANFGSISDKGIYISKAIHKTHIELNEKGTKAAAVTAFMFDKNSEALEPEKVININFNKPFIYLIRDKKTKDIWFLGAVFEPDLYDNNKNCQFE